MKPGAIFCLLLLAFPLLAGCLSGGQAPPVALHAGRFDYCQTGDVDGCLPHGFRFSLEVSRDGISVLDRSGDPTGQMRADTGLWVQTLVDDASPSGWPDVVEFASVGPGLWSVATVGRVLLATPWLDAPLGESTILESEVGSAVVTRRGGTTTLDVHLHPETESEPPTEHTIRFQHPDGVWPPQKIHYVSTEHEIDGRTFHRTSESIGPKIGLELAPAWELPGQPVQRVPSVPAKYGFEQDFEQAVQDASHDPAVFTYQRSHPDWMLQYARIERSDAEALVDLTLLEGCTGLHVQVVYRLGILPMVSTTPTADECRGPMDGLDALASYRLPDPAAFIELAERLDVQGQTRWLEYTAPAEDTPGPRTASGHQTSLDGGWKAAFRTEIEHEGRSFNVDSIFAASLPGDPFAYHTVEVWRAD